MSDIILHGYQSKLKGDVYSDWHKGYRNVLAVLPTGGGKSVVVSDVALDGSRMNIKQSIIAHRNELVSQMSMHIANRGIYHRIIGPDTTISQITKQHRKEYGRSFINPSAPCSVAGVDTIMARSDELKGWANQQDLWTIDECFPAGTLIQTGLDEVRIEKLSVGDEVVSYDDKSNQFFIRKIKKLFKNPIPTKMVRISVNGSFIEATGKHPFWTKRGWIEAKDLKNTDELLIYLHRMSDSFSVEQGTSELSLQKNWKSFLRQEMWDEVSGCAKKTPNQKTCNFDGKNLQNLSENTLSANSKDLLQRVSINHILENDEFDQQKTCFKSNDLKQSNEEFGLSAKNEQYFKTDKSPTTYTRWEWKENSSTGTYFEDVAGTIRVCSSICYQNKYEKGLRLCDLLQTRHGSSYDENIGRSRWSITSLASEKRTRSEERFHSEYLGVESIEVFESGNSDKSIDGFVYNIEVDEFHTYIANKIVVHNCHHVVKTNKWGKAVEMFRNARGLGVTATPQRADGMGLGADYDGVFHSMAIGPTMRELIDMGNLSDYEIVMPESDLYVDDDDIGESGDYSKEKLKKAAKKSHIVGDVVREYFRYALGKQAICFATDIETAGDIAMKFNDAGIRSASLSSKTPTAVREKFIQEFKAGKLSVLVNVDLFDEGFDVPRCEVVIMARPTASLGKYLQMIGRGLRTFLGKLYGLIIDHVSNVLRHGLPDKDRLWSLARRDKRGKQAKDPEDIELTRCKSCTKPYEKVLSCCPHCGAHPPLPEPRERSIAQVDGNLILLDRAKLEEMRKATILQSAGDVAERVAAAAGGAAGTFHANKQIAKIASHKRLFDAIAQWAAIQRSIGRPDDQTYKRFYLTLGVDVLSALAADRTRQEYEETAAKVEGWINAF